MTDSIASEVSEPGYDHLALKDAHIYKKELANQYVVPAMGAMSLVFHVWYFRPDPWVYFLWAYTIPSVFLNFWLSVPRTIRFFGFKVESRDERVDLVRWLFNILVMDIPAILILQPSASVATMAWFMILWAARADMSGSRYANLVTVVALLSYTFCAVILGFEDTIPNILNMIITVLAFALMDRYWISELIDGKIKHVERENLELSLDVLKKDAFLGSSTAIVAHEIRGPLTVLKMLAAHPHLVKKDLLSNSVTKIEEIIDLVLSLKKNQKRDITLGRIFRDIKAITEKSLFLHDDSSRVSLVLPQEDITQQIVVTERTGALFFIISNLIKNAKEAVAEHKRSSEGWVKVEVEPNDWQGQPIDSNSRVCVLVKDNGPGLSKAQIERILGKRLTSGKHDGHGLGLKFVVTEAENNNYSIDIESSPLGTTFRLGLVTPTVEESNDVRALAASAESVNQSIRSFKSDES